jgi:hypothetical protein
MVILTAIIHQEYVLTLELQQDQQHQLDLLGAQDGKGQRHQQQHQDQQQLQEGSLVQGQRLQQGQVLHTIQMPLRKSSLDVGSLWDPLTHASWHPLFTAQRLGSITLADVRVAVARRDALISLAQASVSEV